MINRVQLEALKGPVELAPRTSSPASGPKGLPFSAILGRALSPSSVTFSAHAQQRLDDRNISLNDADRAGISAAMDDAARKGARESVLLTDKATLVVSIANRTVITVVEPNQAQNTVFTNIDSVVVVPRSEPANNAQPTLNHRLDPFRGSLPIAD